jgi:hypothetical protein
MSRILIESRPVDIDGIDSRFRHIYVVFQSDDGTETVITGGPQHNNPFDFGNIVVNAGGLLADSDVARGDDTPADRGSREIDVGARDPADVWAVMLQQAENIDHANLDYQPFSDNSNVVATTVLHAVGIDIEDVLPHHVDSDNAPGLSEEIKFDTTLIGAAGPDVLFGWSGEDTLQGGDGSDQIRGFDGSDVIHGGAGDDILQGDAGADTFLLDVSQQGADTIVDFSPAAGDVIGLSAAGLAKVGLAEFSSAALDQSADFAIVANADGDVEIQHPGGTLTLNGVAFTEGLTFAQLETENLLAIQGLIQGTDAGEQLTGTDGDDVIDAKGGDDTITPLSGDDIIATGAGRDTVNIDPSNPNEGHDIITNFTAPNELDPTVGDSINFALAKLLAADPALPAADGDAASLKLADFDASANWTLGSSEAGNLLFTHPGSSVEFSNAVFGGQQFADLGPVIKVDGAEVPTEGIPVPPASGGEQPVEPVQTEDGAIA